MKSAPSKNENSIAEQSASLFIAKDASLASLLLRHGIKVRDFIVLSFLSDQGPMSILQLSRIVGIDPEGTLQSIRRLAAANLILRSPAQTDERYESVARLTTRGERIAGKINAHLE